MKIKVCQKDIVETFYKSKDQVWRSLENFLESNQRTYLFDDVERTVEIGVSDKSEAISLMSQAGIGTYEIVADEKSQMQPVAKPVGRPRNTVFDKTTGKGMTANQYKKHIRQNSLSQSEIVKRGILTKSQLERAIAAGELNLITIGASHRVLNSALQEYINKLHS